MKFRDDAWNFRSSSDLIRNFIDTAMYVIIRSMNVYGDEYQRNGLASEDREIQESAIRGSRGDFTTAVERTCRSDNNLIRSLHAESPPLTHVHTSDSIAIPIALHFVHTLRDTQATACAVYFPSLSTSCAPAWFYLQMDIARRAREMRQQWQCNTRRSRFHVRPKIRFARVPSRFASYPRVVSVSPRRKRSFATAFVIRSSKINCAPTVNNVFNPSSIVLLSKRC